MYFSIHSPRPVICVKHVQKCNIYEGILKFNLFKTGLGIKIQLFFLEAVDAKSFSGIHNSKCLELIHESKKSKLKKQRKEKKNHIFFQLSFSYIAAISDYMYLLIQSPKSAQEDYMAQVKINNYEVHVKCTFTIDLLWFLLKYR